MYTICKSYIKGQKECHCSSLDCISLPHTQWEKKAISNSIWQTSSKIKSYLCTLASEQVRSGASCFISFCAFWESSVILKMFWVFLHNRHRIYCVQSFTIEKSSSRVLCMDLMVRYEGVCVCV